MQRLQGCTVLGPTTLSPTFPLTPHSTPIFPCQHYSPTAKTDVQSISPPPPPPPPRLRHTIHPPLPTTPQPTRPHTSLFHSFAHLFPSCCPDCFHALQVRNFPSPCPSPSLRAPSPSPLSPCPLSLPPPSLRALSPSPLSPCPLSLSLPHSRSSALFTLCFRQVCGFSRLFLPFHTDRCSVRDVHTDR